MSHMRPFKHESVLVFCCPKCTICTSLAWLTGTHIVAFAFPVYCRPSYVASRLTSEASNDALPCNAISSIDAIIKVAPDETPKFSFLVYMRLIHGRSEQNSSPAALS